MTDDESTDRKKGVSLAKFDVLQTGVFRARRRRFYTHGLPAMHFTATQCEW